MKVIFFDVDGVFNTIREYRLYGENFISTERVKLFCDLIKDTNSKAVLSSSWRKEKKSKTLVFSIFKENGVEIYDCTPVFDKIVERKIEIESWLENKKIIKFAIVDDDTRAEIKGNFFKIDEEVGITKDVCESIKLHLKV